MNEVPDNADLFDQYEQEQERLSKMRKRLAHEYGEEERKKNERTIY